MYALVFQPPTYFGGMKEREVELNNLKDEMSALRKNTGEATDQKNTWATKYEALERNFKQVSIRSYLPPHADGETFVGACVYTIVAAFTAFA